MPKKSKTPPAITVTDLGLMPVASVDMKLHRSVYVLLVRLEDCESLSWTYTDRGKTVEVDGELVDGRALTEQLVALGCTLQQEWAEGGNSNHRVIIPNQRVWEIILATHFADEPPSHSLQ